MLYPRLLALGLAAASIASAQTITETRTFNQEVFEITDTAPSPLFRFGLGLDGPTQIDHGQVVSVDIHLNVQWNIHLRVLNQSGLNTDFEWSNWVTYLSEYGDCSPYSSWLLQGATGPLAPGQVGELHITAPTAVHWSGSQFLTFCQGNWTWTDLWAWDGHDGPGSPFFYGAGFPVPRSWYRILDLRATVNGTMRVEWMPNSIASASICAGTQTPQVSLQANADYENLWLTQSAAPGTFNVLMQSFGASSTVPANGICLGAGSQPVHIMRESLSLGGEPYRVPYDPLFAGTTVYFQSLFRGPLGTFSTGECIGVNFP